ncbi:hypothetical protein [Phenylobacterium sp. J367]|uniref:hypothetical protein n=1 Tax=Phenylobacterium sp. J367 TaxID=2898435 RepID=UPI002150C796|nr:hypothetical protein [Phenylobacterium sp. J367]MCR5879414.1 hypothetical protein [Phenylobacterium sp. J367]
MDFLKLLRSFEELIFEAASWLLFYPRTLWRIMSRPLAAMAYSDAEQSDDEEGRYDDAISPPLFLLFSVVLVNLVGMALHVPTPHVDSTLGAAVSNSPQNLALFRALIFSLIPLVSAATLVREQNIRLARETLRPPFYAQCYLAAAVSIFVGFGSVILQRPDLPNALGLAIMLAGATWFGAVQTRWFSRTLSVRWPRGLWLTVWSVVRALGYMLLIVVPVALL